MFVVDGRVSVLLVCVSAAPQGFHMCVLWRFEALASYIYCMQGVCRASCVDVGSFGVTWHLLLQQCVSAVVVCAYSNAAH